MLASYRPRRWLLVPISLLGAIPLLLAWLTDGDGSAWRVILVIYLAIQAAVWCSLLRSRLILTVDAVYHRTLRTERLARTDLRYATLDDWGGVELVAVSGEKRWVLPFERELFRGRGEQIKDEINAWAGTRDPDPPPAPPPPSPGWYHRGSST